MASADPSTLEWLAGEIERGVCFHATRDPSCTRLEIVTHDNHYRSIVSPHAFRLALEQLRREVDRARAGAGWPDDPLPHGGDDE